MSEPGAAPQPVPPPRTSATPVWRHYTQAELDRQYDSRGSVPDVQLHLAAYAARTAAAKVALRCCENIAYGPGAEARLDLYPVHSPGGPAGAAAKAPVLVFLHGGDWRALSKEDSGFAAPAFVQAGAVFVALDFRLRPEATIPEMGAQVRQALQWLWRHVAEYGGDPDRLHIAGHSSGANLVGQLLMTDWARDFGLPANVVKSAVFMSGLGDLTPVRLSFRNQKLGLTEAMVDEVSLLRRGSPAACPLLVAVGANETEDYRRQARDTAEAWAATGRFARLFTLPGRHHFDAVLAWADPTSELFAAHAALMGLPPGDASRPPAVWRGLSQADLDRAYDQAAWAPNQQQVLQRYAAGSEAARGRLGAPLRFAYGGQPVQQLDMYRTDVEGAAPIAVFIHGGAWRAGLARNYAFFAGLFTAAGAHLVVPDFAAVQEVDGDLQAMAAQLREALAWVHRHADRFGGDASRIHVIGHSSGAHLAAVMATTDWDGAHGLPADLVKGTLCCSGIYELAPCRLSARSAYVRFTDAMVEALSPQRHIDRLRAPLVVAIGTRETPEFQRQARDFAAAVTRAGKPVELLVAEGANHFEILESLALPHGLLGCAALAMMGLPAPAPQGHPATATGC